MSHIPHRPSTPVRRPSSASLNGIGRPESPRRPLDPLPNKDSLERKLMENIQIHHLADPQSPPGINSNTLPPRPPTAPISPRSPDTKVIREAVLHWLDTKGVQHVQQWCEEKCEPLCQNFMQNWLNTNGETMFKVLAQQYLTNLNSGTPQASYQDKLNVITQAQNKTGLFSDGSESGMDGDSSPINGNISPVFASQPNNGANVPPTSGAGTNASSRASLVGLSASRKDAYTRSSMNRTSIGLPSASGQSLLTSNSLLNRDSTGAFVGVSEDGVDAQISPGTILRQKHLSLTNRTGSMSGLVLQLNNEAMLSKGPIAQAIQTSTVTPGPGEIVHPSALQQAEQANATSPQPPAVRSTLIKSRGAGKSNMSGPDLLLVEDVRVSQKIAHAALTRAHFKVEVASDGESAVDKWKTHAGTLRIVLMDIHLPGISGIEATERIRKLERESSSAPVMIFGLTGNVDEDGLRSYEKAGMNGCILKGKLLADAVKQAVDDYSRDPDTFVNLCDKIGDPTDSHSSKTISSTTASSHSTPAGITITSSLANTPAPPTSNAPTLIINTNTFAPSSDSSSDSSKPSLEIDQGLNKRASLTGSKASASAGNRGPDVLLVEDVRVSQRIASQALTRAGFKVDVASDGESAVDKWKTHSQSLKIILMDINLPGISGMEATEQIRKEALKQGLAPIIIFGLTGNVEEENLKAYEQSGMNGCILKGKLLGDAVKQAIEAYSANPKQFVTLADQNASKSLSGTAAETSSPIAPPEPLVVNNALLDASIPSRINSASYSASLVTTSEDENSSGDSGSGSSSPILRLKEKDRLSYRAMSPPSNPALGGLEDDVSPEEQRISFIQHKIKEEESVFGTPRAAQPRQLLNSKFQGRGVIKPGIGLPSATGGSSSSLGLSSESGKSLNGPDLLLVEDVRVSQKIASQTLTRAHYKVEVASDGEEAVEKYKKMSGSLRIILMDINLPGISGIEATERIRKIEPVVGGDHKLYIFGLTGNVDEDSLKSYQKAGMNGCILKGNLLADAVKSAMDQVERNPEGFVNLLATH